MLISEWKKKNQTKKVEDILLTFPLWNELDFDFAQESMQLFLASNLFMLMK